MINPSRAVGAKRGRKAIPPQWSRIIDLDDELAQSKSADGVADRAVFVIEDDMTQFE